MRNAIALIVGPMLIGAIFFLAEGAAQVPGVYLELADGTFPLACTTGSAPSASAPVAIAGIRSFVLVGAKANADDARASAAQLFLRVVNHAEPGTDDGRTPIATSMHKSNSRVYRINATPRMQWDPTGLTNTVYERALQQHSSDRAMTELMVELEIPGATSAPCRYAVVLGPAFAFMNRTVTAFRPPGEVIK